MDKDVKRLVDLEHYGYEDLLLILKILRSPEGCPWDREQTHESIRKNLIEETYEVVEAIDNADMSLMQEELGDLLMQVVFHATMAEESGSFTMADVVNGVAEKLVRRHPHIFGDTVVSDSSDVLRNWDAIKAKEKARVSSADKMRAVPPSLPALMRAEKISFRAAKDGFDFPTKESAAEKIYEEMREVAEAEAEDDIFEEVGDLLFSVVHYARKLGVDPEKALNFASDKFIRRYALMEKKLSESGKTISECDFDTKEKHWKMAKCNKNFE